MEDCTLQIRFITQRHVNILLVVFTDVVCYISRACRVDIIFPDSPVFDVDCSILKYPHVRILYGYADMRKYEHTLPMNGGEDGRGNCRMAGGCILSSCVQQIIGQPPPPFPFGELMLRFEDFISTTDSTIGAGVSWRMSTSEGCRPTSS